MPLPTFTRRAVITSAGTVMASAAVIPAVAADEVCCAPVDPETQGLVGLPLAAVHIQRAVAAMAEPGLAGRWQVTIHSGDPEQYWGFRQVDAVDRAYLKADAYTGRADDLSFVTPKGKGGGFDYWAVESTGDYSADCELGRRLGTEYLDYIGKHPTNVNASLLGCIVDSMMVRRREPRTGYGRHTTGVEMAFLAAVNGYAMATSKVVTDHNA